MRIYAIADIHASYRYLECIRNVVRNRFPDLIVVAGDITQYTSPKPFIRELGQIPVPILAITGNTDLPRVGRILKNTPGIVDINGACVRINTIPFAGISGTIPLPFYSLITTQENKRLKQLKPMVARDTVLVAHPPPQGTLDRVAKKFHAGSPGLKAFILRHQPVMVLCGHIHEEYGSKWLGNTLIVNCAMNRSSHGAVIDYTPGHAPKVDFVPAHTF